MTTGHLLPSLDEPVYDFDPLSWTHDEGALLKQKGSLIPISLFGVRLWAATDEQTARTVFEPHPHVSKDPVHWAAYTRGEVPASWPLLSIVVAESMLNSDGLDHQRLRRLVSFTFTPRRVNALTPRITEITRRLLDDMAAMPIGQPVDLKEQFAYPLPMTVICELFGVTDPDRVQVLRDHYVTMLDVGATGSNASTLSQDSRKCSGSSPTTNVPRQATI